MYENEKWINEMEEWRKPDYQHTDINDEIVHAIWYGPAGPEGDTATEVERIYGDSYNVTEYVCVVGLLDSYPAPILATSTVIEAENALLAPCYGTQYMAHYGGEEEFVKELP